MDTIAHTELLKQRAAAEFTGDDASFTAILHRSLGKQAWSQLEPAIRSRFASSLTHNRSLYFTGIMQTVYCSLPGAVIARIIRRAAVLPDRCARNTPFTFRIGVQNDEIVKQRDYIFDDYQPFTFRSLFRETPALHEEFRGGIGMYLKLAVKRGQLLFRDQNYFLRIGRWRISLHRWLTVGRFELIHRNIDPDRFQILIRVTHPLLGTVFYQRGEFNAHHDDISATTR